MIPFLNKWRPKGYAQKQKDGAWHIIPAVFFPAMIKHIRQAAGSEGLPEELIDRNPVPGVEPEQAARTYKTWAQQITEQAWLDALQPLSATPGDRIVARANALECARMWFTRALKNHEKPPIHIVIERDLDYKLGLR